MELNSRTDCEAQTPAIIVGQGFRLGLHRKRKQKLRRNLHPNRSSILQMDKYTAGSKKTAPSALSRSAPVVEQPLDVPSPLIYSDASRSNMQYCRARSGAGPCLHLSSQAAPKTRRKIKGCDESGSCFQTTADGPHSTTLELPPVHRLEPVLAASAELMKRTSER